MEHEQLVSHIFGVDIAAADVVVVGPTVITTVAAKRHTNLFTWGVDSNAMWWWLCEFDMQFDFCVWFCWRAYLHLPFAVDFL